MAGQLLNSLKSTEKPLSVLSHETKLGMAVISILFCAFCFLVYHKMDLHEKQRQLASIQPNGATSGESDAAGSVALVNEKSSLATTGSEATSTETAEVVDPLISMNDLSTGSPFADSEMSATENAADAKTTDALAGSSLSEPALDAPMLEPLDDSLGTVDPPLMADNNEPFGATQAPPEQHQTPQLDSPVSDGTNSLGLQNETNSSEPALTVAQNNETPSFGFDEANVSTTESTRTVAPETTEPPAFAALDETSPPSDATTVSPSPVDEFPSEPTSQSAETANPPSVSTSPTEHEPVLVAMLEPQQQDGFSGGFSSDGFTADDSSTGITPGRAPATEPSEAFPAFDAEPAAKPQPQQMASNQASQFGSGGFNAVTQPGSRASSKNIRTAAGSGAEADGKFSLAAFNYQNTNVEPAPDDGSTFDSTKVLNGDNYSKISKRVYGTTRYFSALAVFNQHRIPEPKNMRPGMIVLTPPADVLETRYPQLFEDMKPKVPEPAEFMELEDGSPAYRVGERETLSKISERFLGRSSRWVEIYRMNQTIVQDPNRLKPGIILALPADATEVHVAP